MKIFHENIKNISRAVLILGFFDGIHTGHRCVIESAVNYAKENNTKTIILTFDDSPAKYFKGEIEYIFTREHNYALAESLGIDNIISIDFSGLANISAEDYLENIIKLYSPIAIFTGENHTFGKNKLGNPAFLKNNEGKYGYKYFCVKTSCINDMPVSSTNIKSMLKNGDIETANHFLNSTFCLEGKVIHGSQIGRKIGFPTANINYPSNIVKIPYGVYKVITMNKPAILNWGVKPTVDGKHEILEVHIPEYCSDLYGKNLRIDFVKRIRAEKKFNNLDELKSQIKKDVEECLKS